MTYLSVCSGIEAASVAWKPLGFTPLGFSEIERFSCAVLQERFSNVKNYGDITQYEKWTGIEAVDIVVGGTPCQSFSIAGKRGGIADARGALMYAYMGIVGKYQPRWLVWENVPGVLSSGGGADFASFLSGLEKCGYGWAYRVLDAQYFGVPQRRRRVFVVGHSGNRTDLAAKVLFECEGMRGASFSREKDRQEAPGEAGKGADGAGGWNVPLTIDTFFSVSEKISGSLLATHSHTPLRVLTGDVVRSVTPLECERLQGYPDNWTQISYRGKPADECPDTPRYKAIGNSMAVPVMRWIGQRIKQTEESLGFKPIGFAEEVKE